MKLIALAFLSLLLITACEDNDVENNTDTTTHDTVVVKETETIREEAPAKEPADKPAAEPTKKPWADKMAQYHALRCKMHKGVATVTDRTEQVVLLKDLNDIRDGLSKDERFYFNADMVKAEDMATCP